MKIGIVVNVMGSGLAGATTYRLAADATSMGHRVWIMSTGNLAYNPNDTVGALARFVPPGRYTASRYVAALKSDKAVDTWITIDDLDVLLLRSNPSVQHAWAQSAGIHFGRLAMRHGVIVLNDPNGLSKAMNKLYLQTFPESVRPRTLVTRSLDRIERFLDEEQARSSSNRCRDPAARAYSSRERNSSPTSRRSLNQSAATVMSLPNSTCRTRHWVIRGCF